MKVYMLRQVASRSVAKASEAFASLEAAEHTEQLAAYASKRAAREVEWAVQEHSAYSATLCKGKELDKVERGNETEEGDVLQRAVVVKQKKKPKTYLGCCGGALEDDEGPAVAAIATKGVKLDVLEEIEGLDGLSWAPLLLPLAPKKAEMLLCLTLAGGYSNQLVCDAVAREMSAVDPLATTKYVRLLADAAAQETTGHHLLGPIVDTWLSKLVRSLLEATPPPASASETLQKAVSALDSHSFTKTMLALVGLLVAACHLLLATCNLLLPTCYLLLAACCLLLAACYRLLATGYWLLATGYLLLTTHYLPLTVYHLLLTARGPLRTHQQRHRPRGGCTGLVAQPRRGACLHRPPPRRIYGQARGLRRLLAAVEAQLVLGGATHGTRRRRSAPLRDDLLPLPSS